MGSNGHNPGYNEWSDGSGQPRGYQQPYNNLQAYNVAHQDVYQQFQPRYSQLNNYSQQQYVHQQPPFPVYPMNVPQHLRQQQQQQHQPHHMSPQQQHQPQQPHMNYSSQGCTSQYSVPSAAGTSSFPFNANAKPFEPKGGPPAYACYPGIGQGNKPHCGIMTSLYSSDPKEQAEFEDLIKTFGQPKQQYQMSQEIYARMLRSHHNVEIQEILVGLEQVLGDNSEISMWSSAIKERMDMMPDDALIIVFLLICEMAFSLQSTLVEGCDPQYTLSILLKDLLTDDDNANFKTFLEVFESVIKCDSYCITDESKANLLVFTSELYDKLTFKSGAKLTVLGQTLVEQAVSLTNGTKSEEILKAVVRALKLTGSSLEIESGAVPTKFNEVLTRLDAIAVGAPWVPEPIRRQIRSLITLKKRNWGRYDVELDDDESKFIEEQLQKVGGPSSLTLSQSLAATTANTSAEDPTEQEQVADMLADYGQFIQENEDEDKINEEDAKMAAEVDKLTLDEEK